MTYLLFLKMADERTKTPFNKPSIIPQGLDWQSLVSKDGDALETHYRRILETLAFAEERRGYKKRCGAVFHPETADQGHDRGYSTAARDGNLRPRLRHRRLPFSCA